MSAKSTAVDHVTKTSSDYEDGHAAQGEFSSVISDEDRFGFSEKQKKSIIRRIDLRVVGLLGAMYATSSVDNATIGLVLIAGMGADMKLNSTQYSTITSMFYVTFLLFQLPAAVILRKVGPKKFLCTITILWGLTTLACGFVRNWYDLVALRLVLGVWEAGMFPAVTYFLSLWYPRYSMQKRYALWLMLGIIPAAFSGIVCYGISHLAGKGVGPKAWSQSQTGDGIAGWRYIYWIFGACTLCVGIFSFFFIVDFPEKLALGTSKTKRPFLSQEEAAWAVSRVEADRHDVMPPEFRVWEYLGHLKDAKLWAMALCYGCNTVALHGVGFALPYILSEGMGYGVGEAMALSTPPTLLGSITMVFAAYFADRFRRRTPFILVGACMVIVGLSLIGFVEIVGLRYFGVFLSLCGGLSNTPAILAWQANNIRGQWKRGLSTALLSIFASLAGLVGSFVFRAQDKPHYYPGIITCIGAQTIMIIIVLSLNVVFKRANKKAAATGIPIEGLEGFRYTS
ncbi:unnamed protein product [Zymoseptoria tritici ST99CH_1A5]|uniref:Major facilitator superfamily (MFS) profile domain-containing protein n=1 Tax=Zymoseptoria tritici ST99CH_1A5 TaxID=1276529 RepID=A0A1Y6LW90_ZYMTR|nr:unnamed protein product [Zymoseptoria tritici ST99CH_1A5]